MAFKNKFKLFLGLSLLAICGIIYVTYSTVDIYIIRHGQTDWNIQDKMQGISDIPLNELGKQQAEKRANTLSHKNIPIIYSSPLSRAYATASIIAKKTHSKIIIDERLQERNYGLAEGIAHSKYDHYAQTHPNANIETTLAHLQRMLDFLNSHVAFGIHELYIVSHGGSIRRILEFTGYKNYNEKIKNCSIYNFKYNFLTKKYSFVGYKTLNNL